MATGQMSFEKSRHCREPGMCHNVRNCTNERCTLTEACQFIPKVALNGAPCDDACVCVSNTKENIACPEHNAPTFRTPPQDYTIIPPVPVIATEPVVQSILPTGKQERKDTPICSGVLDYFPAALAAIARVSKAGNDQHNPGQPLHWARGKSMDHADCITRHLMERGTIDTDGMSHTAKAAWRILALLQEEEEARGAPMSRGSRVVG